MSEGKVSTCHIAVPVRGTFISVSARYCTDKLEGCITTVIRAPVRCSNGTGSGTITTVSHSIKFQHVTSGTRPGAFSGIPTIANRTTRQSQCPLPTNAWAWLTTPS